MTLDAPTAPGQTWAVYGRNSAGKTKSIGDQLIIGTRRCLALTGRNPLVLSDKTSASRYRRTERDEWETLLDAIAGGRINRLWLWEPSRGSREAWEWLRFLELCVKHHVSIFIESHGEDGRTYDPRGSHDWDVLAKDGVAADSYSRKLSENVLRGKRMGAEAGRPGGHIQFGYRRVYDPNSGDYLRQEIDDVVREWGTSPAAVVRELFDAVHQGRPLAELRRELNDRGIPTPRMIAASERPSRKKAEEYGQLTWHRSVIHGMLTNRAYIGERIRRGETVYTDAWPALVDKATFYAVGTILNDPARRNVKSSKARYLVTHIGRCGHCGGPLVVGLSGTNLPRLRCETTRHCAARMDLVDAEVEAWIWAWVAVPGRLNALYELTSGDEGRALQAQADKLRTEIQQWDAQLDDADADIDPAMFTRRKKALVARLHDVDAEAARVTKFATVQEFTGVTGYRHAMTLWQQLSIARRRDIVRELVDIRLQGVGRGVGSELTPGRLIITPRVDI